MDFRTGVIKMGIPATINSFPLPSIMRADYRVLRSSDAEKATQIINEFTVNCRAMSRDLERGYEAWDAWFAVDGKQWTAKKRKILKEEDRHPWQFDILSTKVDTLAGSLVSDAPDIDWIPVEGERNTLTEAIRETYYSDKDLFNFENVLLECVRHGCIHNGWIQLSESTKYNPAGNVMISNCRPGFFIPSMYWKTDDDRDLKCGYKVAYMTAEGMAHKYKVKADAINRAVEELRKNGKGRYPTDSDELQRRYESSVGDEHRIIEYHYLEDIRTKRLMGVRNNTSCWVPFPVTNDRATLEEFAALNDIDWESVQEAPYDDTVHRVTTVTDLDPTLILEDGKSRIQVKGLPFYHYSCARYNGQDKGVAESLLDLQRLINEEHSYMHEMIAKASGGSDIVNEDIFKDSIKKQDFIKNKNKPGKTFFADLDNVKNVRAEMTPQPLNPAVVTQLDRLYNQMLPLVSRVSETMSAQSSSEDSGIMMERKYQLNRIANVMYDKFIKQLYNNVGEGYFYQWQITYKDTEREITPRTGSGKIYLNRKTLVDGMPVVLNSVPDTPRCRVIISENAHSATNQMRTRMQLNDLSNIISPDDFLRRNALVSRYFDTLDLPDEDAAKMELINEMENMRAQLQFMTQMSNFKAQFKNSEVMALQADRMIEQLTAQAPQIPQAMTPESEQVKMPGPAGQARNNVPGTPMNTIGQNQPVMQAAMANRQMSDQPYAKTLESSVPSTALKE